MATIAFIQGDSGSGAATSTATSAGITTAKGNTLIIAVGQSATGSVWTITDTFKNVWKQAITQAGTTLKIDIYYALNIVGGASHAVTATTNGAALDVLLGVGEFSGIAQKQNVDTTKGGSGTANPATTGASTVTNFTQEVVVGAIIAFDSTTSDVVKDATYTNIVATFTGATGEMLGFEYKILTATGAQTATFSNTVNANEAIVLATFAATSHITPSILRPHPFSPGLAR